MKIATWNVNSLRVRLPQILTWLASAMPDILMLQEIKMESSLFPAEVFAALGYHSSVNGQKTYNGVATLSRLEISEPETEMLDYQDEQRRLLAVTVNGIRMINSYVPNGESLVSLKYAYKLKWLEALSRYISEQLAQYPRLILAGDFNIAPEARDVHDPAAWQDSVLFSESAREAFQVFLKSGLSDSFRLFEQPEKSYSWWDYRMMSFRRNHGLRIDHILLSQSLVASCKTCTIDKIPRGFERPSDHAPVIVELEV